jgi:hypothetical protein
VILTVPQAVLLSIVVPQWQATQQEVLLVPLLPL